MKKKEPILLILICLVLVWILYLSGVYFFESNRYRKLSNSEIKKLQAPTSNDHYKWKSKSHYTVVVYFSIDCPNCIKLFKAEDGHKNEYSRVFSLIYRNYPLLNSEPLAFQKAIVAECVYNQGGDEKMFSFISKMYNEYSKTESNMDLVEALASEYVINPTLLKVCIDDKNTADKIISERDNASQQWVTGTPTIGVFKDNILLGRFDAISGETAINILNTLEEVIIKK